MKIVLKKKPKNIKEIFEKNNQNNKKWNFWKKH